MKLFYCKKCGDIVLLRMYKRYCICKASWGEYINWTQAHISSNAIPLGFLNAEFKDAIDHQPDAGRGKEFTAFVIPKECHTVEVK